MLEIEELQNVISAKIDFLNKFKERIHKLENMLKDYEFDMYIDIVNGTTSKYKKYWQEHIIWDSIKKKFMFRKIYIGENNWDWNADTNIPWDRSQELFDDSIIDIVVKYIKDKMSDNGK